MKASGVGPQQTISPWSVGAHASGDAMAWSVVATLLAGPLVWGSIGWGADWLLGTPRVFTVIGILLGAVLAMYIVWVRYGRTPSASATAPKPAVAADVAGDR